MTDLLRTDSPMGFRRVCTEDSTECELRRIAVAIENGSTTQGLCETMAQVACTSCRVEYLPNIEG